MTQAQPYPRLVIIAAYALAGWAIVIAAGCAVAAAVLVMGVHP